MPKNLSPKQRRILNFIDRFSERNGYPPTLREICKQFHISSTNGARYHLHRLREMGYLDIKPYRSRGVRRRGAAADASRAAHRMPILGRVPAGATDYAAPDIRDGEIILDSDFFGRHVGAELFGLRVKGDSMIEAGIHSGDVVVVRSQSDADDGDIVVARIDDEATVKRFRRDKNRIILEPANPAYEPIEFSREDADRQDIAIIGVVVGLIRAL